jgi:hypothetical protein
MISALLLPLFLAGAPAGIGAAPRGDPPIRLWINNDGRFLRGDHAKVQVQTKDEGYLLVLQADPDGQLRVLFPLDPGDDNFVRGGERYEVKGRGGREAFDIDGTSGRGMVYAAVSRDPFRFDGYRLGDHWDYRALAPSRLPREPESELTDLVRRMAQGDFDYDVLTYDVIERVVYASDYSFAPSNLVISAGFFFGRPFRRFDRPFLSGFDPFFDPFFFDPFFHRGFFFEPFFDRGFFFDPFFNPFFFDPFLHRGFFFDPFLRRRFFHQPVFVDPFFQRPFFFGPRGGAPVPFRDRRNGFHRAVNAADLTPWRVRGGVTASRGRRVELGRDRPVRLAGADGRESAIEARRDNWPVDMSPRRREPAIGVRRDNWPVDVSPRRRDPDLPTARRAEAGRPAEVGPQMDRTPLLDGRRVRGMDDRPGLEMAPPDRGGWESFSSPSDRGGDRGSWSFPSYRGGDRSFAPSARASDGGGHGGGRRR